MQEGKLPRILAPRRPPPLQNTGRFPISTFIDIFSPPQGFQPSYTVSEPTRLSEFLLDSYQSVRPTSSSVAGRETAANAPDTVSSLESRNRCRMRRIYRKMMRRKYTSKSVTGAA